MFCICCELKLSCSARKSTIYSAFSLHSGAPWWQTGPMFLSFAPPGRPCSDLSDCPTVALLACVYIIPKIDVFSKEHFCRSLRMICAKITKQETKKKHNTFVCQFVLCHQLSPSHLSVTGAFKIKATQEPVRYIVWKKKASPVHSTM